MPKLVKDTVDHTVEDETLDVVNKILHLIGFVQAEGEVDDLHDQNQVLVFEFEEDE